MLMIIPYTETAVPVGNQPVLVYPIVGAEKVCDHIPLNVYSKNLGAEVLFPRVVSCHVCP